MDDLFYMNLALDQAKMAAEKDEVPVGAILVDQDGTVIGQGYNQPISLTDPTAHAEIIALRQGAETMGNYRLTHASLYVTIEPCIMCMGAIIHARIARLIFGAADPKWGAAGSLYDIASDQRLNHQPDVVPGILAETSAELIRSFFKRKRST